MKPTVAALTLLAVLLMQVSGGTVSYVCDCTGEAVTTADEHCHGEHGEEGPLQHASAGHHHDHNAPLNDAPEEEHHHHVAVDTSNPADLPTVVSAPELRLLPVFWVELPGAISVPADRFVDATPPPRDDGEPPTTCLLVTRSVVRLI